MKANITVTTQTKRYEPGEEITEKLSAPYEQFLLKHGYISGKSEQSPGKKATKKAGESSGKQGEKPKDSQTLEVQDGLS